MVVAFITIATVSFQEMEACLFFLILTLTKHFWFYRHIWILWPHWLSIFSDKGVRSTICGLWALAWIRTPFVILLALWVLLWHRSSPLLWLFVSVLLLVHYDCCISSKSWHWWLLSLIQGILTENRTCRSWGCLTKPCKSVVIFWSFGFWTFWLCLFWIH